MRSTCIHREPRRHRVHRHAAVLLLSGLCLAGLASGVGAQPVPVAQPLSEQRFAAFVSEASRRFHIPENWIRAVMRAESEHVGDVSLAGAMGLMQIMPDTWSELRARYRLGGNPFDPHDNVIAGAAYLREMFDRYGNVAAMLAAYNAGPRRYDDYLATGHDLPAETRAYVAKLAPLLGGKPLPDGATTVPGRSDDWRDAPLFVVIASDGPPAGSPHADGHTTAAKAPAPAITRDATSPPTDGIFVTVGSEDSAR